MYPINQSNKYLVLLSNIGWFCVANFLSKSILFLMLPIYTCYLTVYEYGIVDLLNTIIQVCLPIFTLQMQDAVLRYTMDKCYEKKDILSIGLLSTVRGTVLLVIGMLLIYFLGLLKIDFIYFFYFAIMYFSSACNNIFSYFCRGIGKVKLFAYSCILVNFITVILNIFFLMYLRLGIRGFLIANALGALLGVLYIWVKGELYRYSDLLNINDNVKHEMIRFSCPMIISALSWWINNASDRFFLLYFTGTVTVGLYAVSSKLPMIIALFSNVISSAFSISAISELDKEDKDSFLGICYTYISFFCVFLCSVLIALNIFLSKFLFSKEFFFAWEFVPPLIFAALMNQLSLVCENFFVAIKNTKIISSTAMISALINIVFNFLLIPEYGAYGAAIATMISYTFLWAIRYNCIKQEINIRNNIKKECITYLLLAMQVILAVFGEKYLVYQFFIIISIVGIYYDKLKGVLFVCPKKHKMVKHNK